MFINLIVLNLSDVYNYCVQENGLNKMCICVVGMREKGRRRRSNVYQKKENAKFLARTQYK